MNPRIGEAMRTFSTTAAGISERSATISSHTSAWRLSTHSRWVEARIVVSSDGATKSITRPWACRVVI
ncbi:MAG: hypothetical protein ACLPUT_12385 [Solirubrobacteraceae bacterium]